jgi:hypothetical protein
MKLARLLSFVWALIFVILIKYILKLTLSWKVVLIFIIVEILCTIDCLNQNFGEKKIMVNERINQYDNFLLLL